MSFSKFQLSNVKYSGAFCKSLLLGGACALSLNIAGCGGEGSSANSDTTSYSTSNTAPVVDSAETTSVSENSTSSFYTLVVSDADDDGLSSVEIDAADDGAFFTIDSESLEISAVAGLDFETPNDLDADNVYDITMLVTDDRGASSTFSLSITVEDVFESPYGLKINVPPSDNFDLLDWKLDLAINASGELEVGGDNLTILENELSAGYTNEDYFYTASDGGMVFRSPTTGSTTSSGTIYVRTELREMLRRGDTTIDTKNDDYTPNKNNWAFSSAPQDAQDSAGGVDGDLSVTMAINEVTTTGENYQIGRVIIGQIHAKDDEPLRLYYRLLPGNSNGAIYAAHELSGGDDTYYEIIGSRSNSATDPADGIPLGEIFSYTVKVVGHSLDVTITKDNGDVFTQNIDMTDSGYDVEDDYMYFKVGAYHVNNSADDGEFAQLTVYQLENTHEGYPF